jgi:IS1 family transposase
LDADLSYRWVIIACRFTETATIFIKDLASRLKNRVQLTTDGHRPYLVAIEDVFGANIDYAMLVKIYGPEPEGQKRYSPAKIIDTDRKSISGNPDPDHISTSYAERQNLTMRMHMRRFTRLTNAHSKRIENHMDAISLHFFYYNFCKIHQSLRVTPAMEAKVTDRLWGIEDIVKLCN